MRNFSSCKKCRDKKYLLAFLITLVCSVLCGVILYKPVTTNIYFVNMGYEYVYNVFNFNNTPLFFAHFLGSILSFYLFFLICYFTKFKYLTLIFLYLRGLFFGIYTVILVCVNSLGGILVAIFVFVPATLISFAVCAVISELCKKFDKRFAFIVPTVLALLDGIVLMILINVVFRVVIIIV